MRGNAPSLHRHERLPDLFSLASDDLEELRKLQAAIEHGAMRLYVPEQIKDEIERNREARFVESLEHLRGMRPKGGLPQMARELSSTQGFQDALRDFGAQLNVLESELVGLFDRRALGADKSSMSC